MDIETKLDLIKKPPMEEIITEQELRELLETNNHPAAYDGFEPSGIAHLGSGILRAIKVQDLNKAGIKFKFFIADWFAFINNKMGGDIEKIQRAGEYLLEVWKAAGADMKKNEVVWHSEFVKNPDYWKTVMKVMKMTTIERMKRAGAIMGRKQDEITYAAQMLYPAMQASDPFFLKVQICQLGIDQRKAYVLSREIGPKLGFWKPIIASHHLLIGLQGPEKMGGYEDRKDVDTEIASKMSKSLPKSFISVHDSDAEIKDKIASAFCPPRMVELNPILEICKHILFRKFDSLKVERRKEFGGDVEYDSYDFLEKEFRDGKLHPVDLKNSVAMHLSEILKPIRKHFEKNKAHELLEFMKKQQITR